MPASILIADDYDDNRELLRLLLANAGYQVSEARNGEECVAMAREKPPDLIVIDLSMPVLDGWGVFRELKAESRTAGIPCVAVTAFADDDRDVALKTGFSAYISKPYRTAELLKILEQILNVKKANGKG